MLNDQFQQLFKIQTNDPQIVIPDDVLHKVNIRVGAKVECQSPDDF